MDRFVFITLLFLFCAVAPANAQPQAPYGLSQIVDDQYVTFYWYYPSINESTIPVFADEPQSYYFYSSADVGARVASAFELAANTDAISAVEIFLWPTDPLPGYPGGTTTSFDLAISESLPVDTLATPLWQCRTSNDHPGIKTWLQIPVRRKIASDSAYLEFRWLPGTPTAPLPGVMYESHFTNSYEGRRQGAGVVWNQIYDASVMLRLVVARPDFDGISPFSAAVPDSFCIYILDSPEEPAGNPAIVISTRDSLHTSVARDEVEGKFVTVAAWDNGVMSAKSEITKVDVSTAVESESDQILPGELMQNYPNPFNSETTICAPNNHDLLIYDLLGRQVRRLSAHESSREGPFCFHWNGADDSGAPVPTGVYFYRQTGQSPVRKLILLK